jgi:ribonuclease Z
MAKLIILGSSNAIPDATHENTHMAFQGQESTVLVDCVSNPILRLQQAGLSFNKVTDLILTHFHPDHVSGVPLLLMGMWLMGHARNVDIYGLHHTLDRIEDLMGFYDWDHWPDFFPVAFHRLPHREDMPVLENGDFRIIASPVRHLVPTIGLRIECVQSGKVVAYSCDTEPCPAVVELAQGADVLIHEASGAFPGHTSATQAGDIARKAGAKKLYLIHYPTGKNDPRPLVDEAGEVFGGEVQLAEDFMEIEL